MIEKIINAGLAYPEYGVVYELYGVPPPVTTPEFWVAVLRFIIFPFMLLVIMVVGLVVLIRKKAWPLWSKVLLVVGAALVYLGLYVGIRILGFWWGWW